MAKPSLPPHPECLCTFAPSTIEGQLGPPCLHISPVAEPKADFGRYGMWFLMLPVDDLDLSSLDWSAVFDLPGRGEKSGRGDADAHGAGALRISCTACGNPPQASAATDPLHGACTWHLLPAMGAHVVQPALIDTATRSRTSTRRMHVHTRADLAPRRAAAEHCTTILSSPPAATERARAAAHESHVCYGHSTTR